jgi:hypothetical protein
MRRAKSREKQSPNFAGQEEELAGENEKNKSVFNRRRKKCGQGNYLSPSRENESFVRTVEGEWLFPMLVTRSTADVVRS